MAVGDVTIGAAVLPAIRLTGRVFIDGGTDASLSDGSGFLIIGSEDGLNFVYDNNEILARNNGANATLNLQADGGDLLYHGNVAGEDNLRIKTVGQAGATEADFITISIDGAGDTFLRGFATK